MSQSEALKPAIMFVRTTENCNAGCFMCDFARLNGKPVMSEPQVERIATEAKAAGIRMIRFTGGEPMLDRNLASYIKYLHDQGLITSVITNGYFLPFRASNMVSAGLDQVIVSLDGSNSDLHDRLRNTPHLFRNATNGIATLRQADPDMVLRVNTVVSPENIGDLEGMLELVTNLGVDQWSIIPLKGQDNLWDPSKTDKYLNQYSDFRKMVENIENPHFMGYSRQWAGRNETETRRYFTQGIPFTPKGRCDLVHRVRFYIPTEDKLAACNCVPWRLREVELPTNVGLSGLNTDELIPLVNYLNVNGPTTCTGCEPNNAFLGENPETLDENIFNF